MTVPAWLQCRVKVGVECSLEARLPRAEGGRTCDIGRRMILGSSAGTVVGNSSDTCILVNPSQCDAGARNTHLICGTPSHDKGGQLSLMPLIQVPERATRIIPNFKRRLGRTVAEAEVQTTTTHASSGFL
jgi:hypothetical protein